MKAAEVIEELRSLGGESYRKVLANHGVAGTCFGVKIADMKKIVKRIRGDQALAMELYESGIFDAMYLAGLVADGAKMSKKDLERWAKGARAAMIAEYTVPWVASESPHGRELALAWIDSGDERTACAGWGTLASIALTRPDAELDLSLYRKLLARVAKTIHGAPNRVRYVMNSFVIAVGSAVAPLHAAALETAAKVGEVSVDMGGTSCKVPDAAGYIAKTVARSGPGKKRKTVRC